MAKVRKDYRKRKHGRPVWILDYQDLNGKRRQLKTDAPSKKAAEAILRRKLSEIAKAESLGLSSLDRLKVKTFGDFVNDDYLPHIKATKRKSHYDTCLTRWNQVKTKFAGMKLTAITLADVQRYIVDRMNSATRNDRPPRPATVNREREFIQAVLSEALRRGLIDRNPLAGGVLKKLAEDNKLDRWITEAEEKKILKHAEPWVRPIIVFAIHTGMRRGEIVRLKWADINRETGLIRVPHAKNHKTRYVPINSVVEEILDSRSRFVGPDGASPFVFVNTGRKPYKPYTGSGVYHAFERAVEDAELDDVVFHTCRHTFASRLRQLGVPAEDIQKMLGHSSSHMTDRYAHLAPDQLRGKTDVLARGKRKKRRRLATNTQQNRGRKNPSG